MDLALKYDRAARSWDRKIGRLGYGDAYAGFLTGRTIAHGPVLDVGAGTGAFALAWVAAGGSSDLTLVDSSQAMLARARANFATPGIVPKTAVAGLEEFEPQMPCAAILAAHAIEHSADPGTAIVRMANWLQPGGRLFMVISRPHWCNWLVWLRFRHRWFSEPQVLAMARTARLRHQLTHAFHAGPPSRTSRGYIFVKS